MTRRNQGAAAADPDAGAQNNQNVAEKTAAETSAGSGQVLATEGSKKPEGIIMSPEALANLIATAVAQGVEATMARYAAAQAVDPHAPPPPDPEEVRTELEAQLSEARYLVVISKGAKDCVDPVPIGVNGILRTVKRGDYALLTRSMLEVLENGVEMHLNPDTQEPYEVPSYPYTVLREIPQDEWAFGMEKLIELYAPKRASAGGSHRLVTARPASS
jgi:hypothetical protein